MKRLAAVLLLIAVSLIAPAQAQDARLEAAFTEIEQGNWGAASALANAALQEAKTPADQFFAREVLATVDYYLIGDDSTIARLTALNAEAIALFGSLDPRRLGVLELLGTTQGLIGNPTEAARNLTQYTRIARLDQDNPDPLQIGLLNLAWTYYEAGFNQTAATIAADLSEIALWQHGAEDEIYLEAGLIRAFAHMDMGHPAEALIHAGPAFSFGIDRLETEFPDILVLLTEFYTALSEIAGRRGDSDPEQVLARWFQEAEDTRLQRQDADLKYSESITAFEAAIVARDIAQADAIARDMTAVILSDEPFVASVYSTMSTVHFNDGNAAAAMPWIKRLADLPTGFLATRDDDQVLDLLYQSYEWQTHHRRYREALFLVDKAIAIADLQVGPDAPLVQKQRYDRAEILFAARDLDAVADEINLALNANATHPDSSPVLRATLLSLMGQMYEAKRDIPAAESYLRDAAALLAELGLTNDIRWADLTLALAAVQQKLGNYDAAIDLMRASLKVRAQTDERSAVAVQIGQVALAVALFNAERHEEALAVFDQAYATFDELSGEANLLRPEMMLAHARMLEETGEQDAADKLVANVEAMLKQTNESANPLVVYGKLAWEAWRNGDLDATEEFANQVLNSLPGGDPERLEFVDLKGRLQLARREDLKALNTFRTVTQALNRPGQSNVVLAQDHFPLHIEAALRLANAPGQPATVQYMSEAFSIAQHVNTLSAGHAVTRAAARWDAVPELAGKVRELQDLAAEIENLTAEFAKALGRGENGVEVKNLLDRAHEQHTALKSDVAINFPNYARIADPVAIDVIKAASLLAPDEVMVLYATSDEQSETGLHGSVIIAVSSDSIMTASTATRSDLQDIAHDLRCAAALTDKNCGRGAAGTRGAFSLEEDPDEDGLTFDLGLASRAYQMVLAPVESILAGKTKLIVVPDQSLVALPFHLLVDRKPTATTTLRNADWLIRDKSVVMVPTVASLDVLRTQPRRRNGANGWFLGIGDPLIGIQKNGKIPFDCKQTAPEKIFAEALALKSDALLLKRGADMDTTALSSLSALPETRCELQTAAQHFGENSVLMLQAEATETALKSLSRSGELKKYRMITFATHGLIAGEVGEFDAGLVLTPPGRATLLDDGLLTTGEIAQLDLDADIVFLSACNTAAGDADSSEGLSGLASAFFYAGARSLLVSHWPVYSVAATDITTRTLSNINTDPEIGFAEALRLAMLSILDDPDADERRQHPSYWGPFVVVGEGAVL